MYSGLEVRIPASSCLVHHFELEGSGDAEAAVRDRSGNDRRVPDRRHVGQRRSRQRCHADECIAVEATKSSGAASANGQGQGISDRLLDFSGPWLTDPGTLEACEAAFIAIWIDESNPIPPRHEVVES